MKFRLILLAKAAVLCFMPMSVSAQNALLEFTSSLFSFSAEFTQTVYDSDSVALQESVGSVELMRPGRFRWTYTEPSSQLIVADGITLWVYDEDIKQVTAQPQSETLGNAPIGLLSGQRSIESDFTVAELGEEEGLSWFELTPLEQDTDFNTLFIALSESGLHAMELRDNFDQATQIKFTNFNKNIAIDAERFAFTPPEGADVIGEVGTASALVPPPQPQVVPEAPEVVPPTVTAVEPSSEPDELPIAEPVPLPKTKTIIDGTELQIQEITQ